MLFNNKQIKNKRFSFVFLSLVLLFSMLLTTAISVRAETFLVNNANDFDNSNVYDDLSSSDINISDYNFDSSGQTEVIQMVEYCFSYDLDYIDNYALYLYVYNPSCTLYDVNNANNTVTMATEYTNGTPTTYTKYDLKFCNKADIYYDRLFYKFRIVDKFENGSSILTRVYNQFISDSTDNELTEVSRSYSISEIELCYNNTMTAINVSQSYSFTGFASGYGSEESTLECNASKLETIQIDEIYSTYYRPDGVSSLGENHQWQLNSVYFAIPDKYTDNYGELTKISCEWYEYKTKPAIVCDDSDVVSDMQDYLTTNSRQSIGNSNIPYGFCFGNEYAYNGVLADGLISEIYSTYLNRLYYLFYSSSLGSITSDSIANYVYDYDKSFDSGTIEVNGSSISNDLFTSSVDSGRTLGYNKKTLDNENSGDWFDMPDYDSTHSAWQKFWDLVFLVQQQTSLLKMFCPL